MSGGAQDAPALAGKAHAPGYVPRSRALALVERPRALWLLFALVFLAALAAAAYTSLRIGERQASVHAASRSNLIYLTGQAATALARLEQSVSALAEGQPAPGVAAALDATANRAALLQSRGFTEFLAANPQVAGVPARLAAAVAQVRPALADLAGAGLDGRRATAAAVLAKLSLLDEQLPQFAAAANAYTGARVDEDKRSLVIMHWMLTGLLLALLGGGGLLLAVLARNRRALQQANVEARALAASLQRTGADLAAANAAVHAANRQLQQRNDALRQRDEELFTQYHRFEAALDNMSQALCMVGRGGALVVCNRRFLQMFRISEAMALPGLDIADVRASILQARAYPRDLMEEVFRRQDGQAGQDLLAFQEDAAGRTLGVSHQPMEGGGWVATYEDLTDRSRADARISFMAHHDALTGLPNRLLFRDRMEQALALSTRGGSGFAVFCLDLDRFKAVNDTLGHGIGDMLLEAVAQRLRECVRGTDTVARLGADEFAILQIGAEQPQTASSLASRLQEAVNAPYDLGGQRIQVSISGGVTMAPADGTASDRLLRNADMALRQSKDGGQSRITFYQTAMDERLQARRRIEADLAHALENNEFEVAYHPLVCLDPRAPAGFEALLRWRHRDRLIQPGEFIPVAEDTGLIGAIGAWVLRRACMDAAAWPAPVRVAVNLSALQLRDEGFVQSVSGALAAARLPAWRLELEVTERLLMADNEANVRTLHELRALGVRISMDDFGTGYSSLSYLRQFPFDNIKIDQSFIREMVRSADCVAIVVSIARLADSLGMTTTAEGVETEEHLRLVREAGCTEAQGFLFGQPLPAPGAASLLSGLTEAPRAA